MYGVLSISLLLLFNSLFNCEESYLQTKPLKKGTLAFAVDAHLCRFHSVMK
jgi:hypothetical protein